jgi:hypothetical protein
MRFFYLILFISFPINCLSSNCFKKYVTCLAPLNSSSYSLQAKSINQEFIYLIYKSKTASEDSAIEGSIIDNNGQLTLRSKSGFVKAINSAEYADECENEYKKCQKNQKAVKGFQK